MYKTNQDRDPTKVARRTGTAKVSKSSPVPTPPAPTPISSEEILRAARDALHRLQEANTVTQVTSKQITSTVTDHKQDRSDIIKGNIQTTPITTAIAIRNINPFPYPAEHPIGITGQLFSPNPFGQKMHKISPFLSDCVISRKKRYAPLIGALARLFGVAARGARLGLTGGKAAIGGIRAGGTALKEMTPRWIIVGGKKIGKVANWASIPVSIAMVATDKAMVRVAQVGGHLSTRVTRFIGSQRSKWSRFAREHPRAAKSTIAALGLATLSSATATSVVAALDPSVFSELEHFNDAQIAKLIDESNLPEEAVRDLLQSDGELTVSSILTAMDLFKAYKEQAVQRGATLEQLPESMPLEFSNVPFPIVSVLRENLRMSKEQAEAQNSFIKRGIRDGACWWLSTPEEDLCTNDKRYNITNIDTDLDTISDPVHRYSVRELQQKAAAVLKRQKETEPEDPNDSMNMGETMIYREENEMMKLWENTVEEVTNDTTVGVSEPPSTDVGMIILATIITVVLTVMTAVAVNITYHWYKHRRGDYVPSMQPLTESNIINQSYVRARSFDPSANELETVPEDIPLEESQTEHMI